jgi:hypothetical protein
MKKIFVLACILVLTVLCCVSCGNKAIFDPGSFSFKHVHISDHTEGHCLEIDKWWDGDSGIEVRMTNGKGVFLSEGTYQLFESSASCPYCN